MNGMLQYGLPLLTELTPQFAQIVFNAGGSRGNVNLMLRSIKMIIVFMHFGMLWIVG